MKINPKLYEVANDVQPFETQDLPKRKIELFYMSDFVGVEEEFVRGKGQFATWASVDGVNYRLYIEKGYYEEVKDLYSAKVNEIWTDFWDATDGVSKSFSKKFILPAMLVMLALCIASFWMGNIGTYIMLGALAVMIVVYMVASRWMKKQIMLENTKSRELIIQHLGEKEFDEIIDKQKNYMDSYFDKLNEDEEETESADAEVIDSEPVEEEAPVVEAEVIEAPAAEEAPAEEVAETVEEVKKEEE